jgi:predicted nucleic-acid-binding protein
MRAVDTNVLVRLVTRDDAKQVAAAEAFIAPGAWVSHLVLAEAMWVLTSVYDLGPSAIATAVEMLLNHRDLSLQDADVVTAALAHCRKRPYETSQRGRVYRGSGGSGCGFISASDRRSRGRDKT